ncbi:MAG: ABC transporter permease [Burkholderiales bacterium]|nr:ABC transporter permease [Burkholderiales bacterium]
MILALWETASNLNWISSFILPAPSTLALTLYELITDGFPEGIKIQAHIAATMSRVISGFALAALIGVPLGIAIGAVPVLDKLSASVIAFGRSIAAISVLPLFIAWFGIGEASKVALLFFGAFWVVLTYTVAGVKYVDPMLIRAALSVGTPQRRIFFRVILPAALPRVFAGLKVALGVAFLVIVAAEMIATVKGLGALIQEARTSFRTDITMVGMIVIGLLGYLLSRLLDWAEKRLMPWNVRLMERAR